MTNTRHDEPSPCQAHKFSRSERYIYWLECQVCGHLQQLDQSEWANAHKTWPDFLETLKKRRVMLNDERLIAYLELESVMSPHVLELRAAMFEWVKHKTPNALIALIRANTPDAKSDPGLKAVQP